MTPHRTIPGFLDRDVAPAGPERSSHRAPVRSSDRASVFGPVPPREEALFEAASCPSPTAESVLASWSQRPARSSTAPPAWEQEHRAPSRQRLIRAFGTPLLAAIAVFVLAVAVSVSVTVVQQGPRFAWPWSEATESGSAGSGAGSAASASPHTQGGDAVLQKEGQGAATSEGNAVTVHVVGAVAQPGVVAVPAGARITDALAAAGGPTPEAVLAGVNLARAVVDGEQIVVPHQHDAAAGATAATGDPAESFPASDSMVGSGGAGAGAPISLNTATVTELESLPRIGPALAARILQWREQHGPFRSVDDLLNVSGIGEKTLDGFRDRVVAP